MSQLESNCNTGQVPVQRTYRKIAASLRKQKLKPTEQEQLAAYVELACRRHDWNEDARREELPAYEVALATVVVLEAFLRRVDNRMRNGRLRSTGFETREPEHGPVLVDGPPAVTRLAYVEPKPEPYTEPTPVEQPREHEYSGDKDQRGFCLGNVVDAGDELSWFYGQSALEVGYTSTYDALVVRIASHCAVFTSQGPVGPNPQMMAAARRQRDVMAALRQLPQRQQAILELAYTDRRYRQQFVTTFGAGVAAIVARADQAKRAFDANPEGEVLVAFQRMLMALSGHHRKITDWSPLNLEGCKGSLEHRKREAATNLLSAAQSAYRAARGLAEPRKPKPPPGAARARLEPVPVRSLSPRRQLIEVVRRAA